MARPGKETAPTILIACQAWHQEHFGGAFKLAAELAGFLAEQGHEVHFLCGTDEPITSNPVEHAGVKLWRYPNPRRPSPSPFNLLGHLYGSWRVAGKIAEAARIDCINGHSPLQFLGATSALAESRIRKVYSVHSPFADELRAQWSVANTCLQGTDQGSAGNSPSGDPCKARLPGFNPVKRLALRIVQLLEQRVYRLADAVQCDSAYSLSLITREYPNAVAGKGLVCPGWVDTGRFRPAKTRNLLRRRLGEPWLPGTTTFLTVRRLEHRMGLDNLIEACHILRLQGYKFRLLIGGSGPLRGDLERLVEKTQLTKAVHFLGRVPESDLPACYAAADCFVLPTRTLECFGLIALEALACNTPVVATPVGSIPEVMGTRQAGRWLTRDTTPEALAETMKVYLDHETRTDFTELRAYASLYDPADVLPRLRDIVTGYRAEPNAPLPAAL